jgi:two-component system chemotaxis response regulator CheB
MPVRVLLVDDSVMVRKRLREALSSAPQLEVVGSAASGAIALAQIPRLQPDVVTLDVEMPGMDGIQTLKQIRKFYPKLPVIMLSTLTERGAAITLEALALGASDYLTPPSNTPTLSNALEQVRQELIAKIISLGSRSKPIVSVSLAPASRKSLCQRIDLVAIGVSTGGPNALAEVIPRLPADFPAPIVIVQHMPPLFTRLLAERLAAQSQILVHEAQAGAILQAGHAWIAPGDYHLALARNGSGIALRLTQEAHENSCRPAVDVLFRSVAQIYGPGALAIIMTGMGSDGARGAAQIREAGGEIFVQDEASSVVWGMPGAVVEAGVADKICPLDQLATEIIRRVRIGRALAAAASSPADATKRSS